MRCQIGKGGIKERDHTQIKNPGRAQATHIHKMWTPNGQSCTKIFVVTETVYIEN